MDKNVWICTDDDCCQYRKILGDGNYELIQITAITDEHYVVNYAKFNVYEDFSKSEQKQVLEWYDYDSSIPEAILAECLFESFCCPNDIIATKTTFEEAEAYINEFIRKEN